MNREAIERLEKGVEIKINKKAFHTAPAKCMLLDNSPNLPERVPPIRFRKSIPAPWIELKLTEGKNRQVRKMTAKVGFPTLRLVRYAIEDLTIDGMLPGDIAELDKKVVSEKLRIPILA
jgi:23S rRNA pseudouridine2457 synthase